jgi:hypothetical protein
MKKLHFKLQVPPQVGGPVRDTKGRRVGTVTATRPSEDDPGLFIVTVEVDEGSAIVQKLTEGLKPNASIGTAT